MMATKRGHGRGPTAWERTVLLWCAKADEDGGSSEAEKTRQRRWLEAGGARLDGRRGGGGALVELREGNGTGGSQ
ncbi:hypothetical protein E2562_024734 [Oryza meyeriana var. granulata]|uniref:Uncharacterized protein n=1 Tax=Oryza meyeriana var. granulata TaxID=110450 RepID=A0A6G1D7E8_9ORYZ|nr:hypothetical protein E2562_024734 [Oryza meyeriana var. granulata]